MTGPELILAGAVATLAAATPLLFAALGELVVEKAGMLNLGLEGMMLTGAMAGFAVTVSGGGAVAGVAAAAAAGAALALGFGVLTLLLRADQVAAGLALTIFGAGLSAFAGRGFVGVPLTPLPPVLFGQDALVWLGLGLVPAVGWFLRRSRAGLILRAVGENHDAAHAIGHPVIAIRFGALAFGGAMSGVGGAYLSLAYTPMWAETMTAGRGWIALALVVFGAWRPGRVLLGAWLFGAVAIGHLHAQALGFPLPAQVLGMLPYLATVVVLVLISRDTAQIRLNAPACLGKVFHPDA